MWSATRQRRKNIRPLSNLSESNRERRASLRNSSSRRHYTPPPPSPTTTMNTTPLLLSFPLPSNDLPSLSLSLLFALTRSHVAKVSLFKFWHDNKKNITKKKTMTMYDGDTNYIYIFFRCTTICLFWQGPLMHILILPKYNEYTWEAFFFISFYILRCLNSRQRKRHIRKEL